MKSILAAAALVIPLALAGASVTSAPAQAKTSVKVYLGVPYYAYQVGPDYRFRPGYGWYRYGHGRLSCGEARRLVARKGYRNVVARDCVGRTYVFRGTRGGQHFQLLVNARTGAVWRG